MNLLSSPVASRTAPPSGSLLRPITSAVGAATPRDGILRGAGDLVDAGKPLDGGLPFGPPWASTALFSSAASGAETAARATLPGARAAGA